MMSVATEAPRIEAPHFVDVRSERVRTTILTGGLPYHRRFGVRKMDTLLIVRGETARRFRLGVGIDLPYPAPAAIEFLAPRTVLAGNGVAAVGRKRLVVPRRRPKRRGDPLGADRVRRSDGGVLCATAGDRRPQDHAWPAVVSRSHRGRGDRFHRPERPLAALRKPTASPSSSAAHEWVQLRVRW